MAAYQANYGFTQEGDPDEKDAAVSSTDPAASKPDSKPSEEQKPGDAIQNPNPEQHVTPTKEAKQKGEKRKADPGDVTSTTKDKRKKTV